MTESPNVPLERTLHTHLAVLASRCAEFLDAHIQIQGQSPGVHSPTPEAVREAVRALEYVIEHYTEEEAYGERQGGL